MKVRNVTANNFLALSKQYMEEVSGISEKAANINGGWGHMIDPVENWEEWAAWKRYRLAKRLSIKMMRAIEQGVRKHRYMVPAKFPSQFDADWKSLPQDVADAIERQKYGSETEEQKHERIMASFQRGA